MYVLATSLLQEEFEYGRYRKPNMGPRKPWGFWREGASLKENPVFSLGS